MALGPVTSGATIGDGGGGEGDGEGGFGGFNFTNASVVTGQDVTLNSEGDMFLRGRQLGRCADYHGRRFADLERRARRGGQHQRCFGRRMTLTTVDAGGDLSLNSGAGIAATTLSAFGSAAVTAVGDIAIDGADAGPALGLTSTGGNVSAGALSGSTIIVTAAGDSSVGEVGGLDLGRIRRGRAGQFLRHRRFSNDHRHLGRHRDRRIGSLGVGGLTDLITLNSTGSSTAIGSGVSGAYTLDEAGDIIADAVVVNAGSGNVEIGNIVIEGSQTSGGGIASATVNTAGSIFVLGDLAFTNAAASDALTLNAGPLIEVVTDTGSVSMTNSSGALSGILSLNADNVWIGTGAVLSQLEADFDFAGRAEALLSNGGNENLDGFVRAGQIDLTVGDSFIVQNSGTETDYAGIAVGDGGLNITNAEPDPLTVIIYGEQTKSDGTTIGGPDFAEVVVVDGPGGVDTGSGV